MGRGPPSSLSPARSGHLARRRASLPLLSTDQPAEQVPPRTLVPPSAVPGAHPPSPSRCCHVRLTSLGTFGQLRGLVSQEFGASRAVSIEASFADLELRRIMSDADLLSRFRWVRNALSLSVTRLLTPAAPLQMVDCRWRSVSATAPSSSYQDSTNPFHQAS